MDKKRWKQTLAMVIACLLMANMGGVPHTVQAAGQVYLSGTGAVQKLEAKYDPGDGRKVQQVVGDRIVQRIKGAKTKVVYRSSNENVARITKVNRERGNWCEITCTGAGEAVITAEAKRDGKYMAASKKFTLYVSPQRAKVVSLQSKKAGQATIRSNDAAKGCDGYQIFYTHDGKNVQIQLKGRKPLSYTVKNLKSGKSIRVRIRAYKERNGRSYYGKYSAWKTLGRVM